MLGRCSHRLFLLNCSAHPATQRYKGSSSTIANDFLKGPRQLTASARSSESSNGPEKTNSGRSLLPTPDLQACLLSSGPDASKSILKRQLSSRLTKRGDFSRISHSLTGSNSPISTPIDFNALLARLQCLGEPIPPQLVVYMMYYAIDNPIAVKCLLDAYQRSIEAWPGERHQPSESDQMSWFEHLSKRITAVLYELPETLWTDRTISRWVWIITGCDGGLSSKTTFSIPPTERDFCLYDLGPGKSQKCWASYVHLLSVLGESKLVASEWQRYMAQNSPAGESGGSALEDSSRQSMNLTISIMLELGDPKRAWDIAYEFGEITKNLDRDVLRALLAYPEYLRKWQPEFEDTALEMLEKELEKVEMEFGLVWKGSEGGHHRTNSVI